MLACFSVRFACLALTAALCGGCAELDVATGTIDHGGTVYTCGDTEYCYLNDAADELSAQVDRTCTETGIGDRWWPGLTNLVGLGCDYSCPPPARGCNSVGGCWCP